MELSKLFLLYIVIILFLYMSKPQLFQFSNLSEDVRRKKLIFLILFILILSLILFYLNVFMEYYM